MRMISSIAVLACCVLMSSCANKNGAPPTIGYSVFYDQGDQLKTLVAKRDYAGAQGLYDKERAFFGKKGDKYGALLTQAAAGLNEVWRPKLQTATASCKAIAWPAPRDRWRSITDTLYVARNVLTEYRAVDLTSHYSRSPDAADLESTIYEKAGRILSDAATIFASEDVWSGKNFANDYPVQIEAFPELLATKLRGSFNPGVTLQQVDVAASAYQYQLGSSAVKAEFDREASELLQSSANSGSISDVLDTYGHLKDHKIAPTAIPITIANNSDLAVDKSLHIALRRDAPFKWRDMSVPNLAPNSIDADFVVIVGAKSGGVTRKVGDYADLQSEYLSGYNSVGNPEYDRAVLRLQSAQEALNNARVMQINASNDVTCVNGVCSQNQWSVLAASIALISATNDFNKAQQVVANTSRTVDVPIYTPYSYSTAVIDVMKRAEVIAYIGRRSPGPYKVISKSLAAHKSFKVVYKVHEKDRYFSRVNSEYATEADADAFEKAPLSVDFSELLAEKGSDVSKFTWQQAQADLLQRAQKNASEAVALRGGAIPVAERRADKDSIRFASVVVIETAGTLGSGFFVTPDTVITNAHVIRGQKYVTMKTYEGESISGKIEVEDRRRDLALVKVTSQKSPVTFSGREISVGAQVEVVGHPQGLDFSLTRGIISQVRTMRPVSGIGGGLVEYIQLDASISPGNSGGPVFQNGEVIGVATWKVSAKDTENLNFAVHRDEVMSFLRENGISLAGPAL